MIGALPAILVMFALAPYWGQVGHAKSILIVALHIAVPVGLLLIWTYVLQRRVAQKSRALEESDAKYRTLVENASDGIALFRRGEFIYTNPSLRRLLGYSEQELGRLPMGALFPATKQGQALSQTLSQMIETHQRPAERVEGELIRKDGQVLDVSASFDLVEIDRETVATMMITDLTESKKMSRELNRADKLDALGLVAGGIAHDFNNILTAISGGLSLARRFCGVPEKKEQLSVLLDSAEKASSRAKELTAQLLTFSKGGEPVKKSTSVLDIVRESSEFGLRGSNVKCEFSIDEDIWPIDVDAGQIVQVLSNLVINADQAMPEGGTISVWAENVTPGQDEAKLLQDGRWVRITVRDHGVGIAEENIEQIFDPYFTTKANGSGLGLATSFSIVRKHGGRIEVESEPGRGSTFRVYLPAADYQPCPPSEAPTESFQGSGRALIMDDDSDVLQTASQMLNELGYSVATARNGAEAIAHYESGLKENLPFDLVLMDLTIPGGMGGRETIKRLLSIDPEVTAIVSSGYYDDPVVASYSAYGFKGVVPKPYTIQELSAALARTLEVEHLL